MCICVHVYALGIKPRVHANILAQPSGSMTLKILPFLIPIKPPLVPLRLTAASGALISFSLVWGCGSVVGQLPSTCEALGLILSTNLKFKKGKDNFPFFLGWVCSSE